MREGGMTMACCSKPKKVAKGKESGAKAGK